MIDMGNIRRHSAVGVTIAIAVTILTVALAPPVARADDWPAPTIREAFSHSRTYFVRVLPGKSFGDTVGFGGAAKGPFATAEFYRLEEDRSYRVNIPRQSRGL